MSPPGILDSGSGIRTFEVRDAGDAAILLELEAVIDPEVNARAVAIAASVAGERLAGVRDVIPTYRSVAVHFDPLAADVETLRGSLRRAADAAPDFQQGSLIEVPVAYGGAHGPDLQDVAAFAKLSPQAVIERHCAVEYRVFMLGFLPGFAYMGSVDPIDRCAAEGHAARADSCRKRRNRRPADGDLSAAIARRMAIDWADGDVRLRSFTRTGFAVRARGSSQVCASRRDQG